MKDLGKVLGWMGRGGRGRGDRMGWGAGGIRWPRGSTRVTVYGRTCRESESA